ncbi:sensor histidine kinase [Pseudomonas nitroreducens]|uniref:sensor histidine kinase n=1 Tax=Pseudomonas nitroreducens TaxID=46680 RepID=UPI002659C7B8|nr:ATP-binding protein [Pseudomonas nitroreducens]MCP1647960.1 two-component system OmpR family sensor kinase [Pseudomonas nitroreducens]MCP1686536.1 two-component system OmpR family sensor kinase [Pseudomonas nitroreducens]
MDGLQRRLRDSVQFRLSLALCATILIVAMLAGIFAFVSAYDEALEMQDNTLKQVAALFERQQMTLQYPAAAPAIAGDNEETRVVVQYLADSANAPGTGDNSLPLPIPSTLQEGFSTVAVAGEEFRVLVRTTAGGQRIAVAQETGSRDRDARESAWRGLIPLVILIPVLLLVVADLVRKLFRPIATLSSELDRRDEQDMAPIETRHLPTEVRSFVLAINRLLGRVARSMESQRRFVADAAHELRSPLTALSLQAERLAATPMSEPARERLSKLRQGIERGRNLIDQLLALASAQSSTAAPEQQVSVHKVYRAVLEELLPVADRKQIDLGVEGDDCEVVVNEFDLQMLIKNLADNAVRYTPPGGKVDLLVQRRGAVVVLQVRDTGPGIPEAERERVFDAFYRIAGSEEIGSGLGLSIVSAIAQRLGARITLDYSDPDSRSGLCVQLEFPA